MNEQSRMNWKVSKWGVLKKELKTEKGPITVIKGVEGGVRSVTFKSVDMGQF